MTENIMDVVEAFPTSMSALHFSLNTHDFSSTLSSLKRSTLSTQNRLRSIEHDSQFVQSVASRFNLPLIANQRCGSWYVPPEKEAGSAYFKSTDGHFGEWAFSMRRLNLQILETIGRSGGCIIVDSTRRGKSMPDALSKTLPIWCAVLNRLLFLEGHWLWTPVETVSGSEHDQIEARLHDFLTELYDLKLDTYALRKVLKKPLMCSWVTPEMEALTTWDCGQYNRILCCTASRRVDGTEASENGYIQGAADDHEAWSQGLTPSLFWAHKDKLLAMTDDEVGDFVRSCHAAKDVHTMSEMCPIRISTTGIHIASNLDTVQTQDYDGLVRLSSNQTSPFKQASEQFTSGPILQISCKPGKLGSRALRTHLESIIPFLDFVFSKHHSPSILIMCHDGQDLSVGVALAALCRFYDDNDEPTTKTSRTPINKIMIRRRLAKITSAKPTANPSRATLQSVHAFLMC